MKTFAQAHLKFPIIVIPAYDFASALALSKSEYPCGAEAGMTVLMGILN
jgi:hypothetical protein